MSEKLNQYGDYLIKTSGTHGADISSQRIDDLDKKSLEYILKNSDKNLNGIDIGCGLGIQGIRFSLLGAKVFMIDILDIHDRIQAISNYLGLQNKLEYIKSDLRDFETINLTKGLDFIYSQRFIHYLNYQEANKLLAHLSLISNEGAFLFISASGIHSELGNGYIGNDIPINQRYCHLAPEMAEKHNILEKVCLYSKDELSILVTQNNFTPTDIWESTFGNIKIIAQKKKKISI